MRYRSTDKNAPLTPLPFSSITHLPPPPLVNVQKIHAAKQVGIVLLLAWIFCPAISPSHAVDGVRRSLLQPVQSAAFVPTTGSDGKCPELWADWPVVQERALERGTVMVWNLSSSMGNLMRTLMYILPVRCSPSMDVSLGRRLWMLGTGHPSRGRDCRHAFRR